MKHSKRILAIVLMATLLVTAMSVTATPAFAASKKAKTVKTTKVVLSQTGTVTLNVGETLSLSATLKRENSTQAVKWSTSKKSVATVKCSTSNKKVATVKNGVVTPKKKGTATITVKVGKKKAKVKVVKASSTPVDPTPVPVKPTPAPTPDPTPAPHSHTWEDVTTTVTHDEEGHWEVQNTKAQTGTTTTYVDHPAEGHWETVTSEQMVKEAWDEDVVVDKPAWSEVKGTAIRNNCGAVITDHSQLRGTIHIGYPCTTVTYSDMYDTPENRAIYDWPGPNAAGMYNHVVDTWVDDAGQAWMRVERRGTQGGLNIINETVTHPAETHVEVVHHDAEYQTITDKVWVEDKAAWTEEVVTPQYGYETKQVWVVDKAAWTETVVTGQTCTGCGATK